MATVTKVPAAPPPPPDYDIRVSLLEKRIIGWCLGEQTEVDIKRNFGTGGYSVFRALYRDINSED